jgi:hypothetical protein
MATSLEKFVKFQPIQDEYQRYMRERERNREKRPPEKGASYPKRAVDETIRERVNKFRDKEFLDKELEDENKYKQEYTQEEDQLPETSVRPKVSETAKPRSEGVDRMQRRMRESLGEEDNTPTITITKKAKEPEERKPRYIAGFEKSGRPSSIRVGGSKPSSSPEQLEARKKMLRRNAIFGRK